MTLPLCEIRHLLLEVARVSMSAGSSSNRTEILLQRLGETFGCEVEAAAMPTAVWITVRRGEEHAQELARVRSWGTHLLQITELSALVDDLHAQKISLQHAENRLQEIKRLKSPYPRALMFFAGGFSASSVMFFYGGNWREIACAIIVGMLVEGVYRYGVVKEHRWVVADFLSGIVAGATALMIASFVKDVDVSRLIVSGLIVRVPGLVFVNAIHEVAQKNLASGSGRLLEAAIIGLSLAFGVGFALSIAALIRGGHVG